MGVGVGLMVQPPTYTDCWEIWMLWCTQIFIGGAAREGKKAMVQTPTQLDVGHS